MTSPNRVFFLENMGVATAPHAERAWPRIHETKVLLWPEMRETVPNLTFKAPGASMFPGSEPTCGSAAKDPLPNSDGCQIPLFWHE